jgi:hypothetical protein
MTKSVTIRVPTTPPPWLPSAPPAMRAGFTTATTRSNANWSKTVQRQAAKRDSYDRQPNKDPSMFGAHLGLVMIELDLAYFYFHIFLYIETKVMKNY